MKLVRKGSQLFSKLVERNFCFKRKISKKVSKIIEDVRLRGDSAVIEYTKSFDKVKLTSKTLKITEEEINSSFSSLDSSLILSLKTAIDNVFKFYRQQLPKKFKLKTEEGKKIEEVFLPLEKVGIYIPAGQSPLVSSVYMSAIPAIVAGVKQIILVSPPTFNGSINPYILATASLLKIKDIYKVGGAQAISALAFGTDTIPKVDKIVGPGNEYVTEAKRQVFGIVDIDMLAGPTELVVVAGRKANPEYILKDLQAQTEHRLSIGIVITLSKTLSKQLRKVNLPSVYLIEAKNLEEAVNLVNKISPEHLEIMLKDWRSFLKKLRHAPAVFLGDYSPVALGDYLAGPSHVLPTGGSARFFSGLSVYDFLKRVHLVYYSKKALLKDSQALEKIASLEKMEKHIESVKVRLK
ncbi:MAG: histidinol dehydrogenase [Candidatus Omnitrophica bacterium]|nr:histidinol dehydrogenase [Candidatus Omnitrophota bacterium]